MKKSAKPPVSKVSSEPVKSRQMITSVMNKQSKIVQDKDEGDDDDEEEDEEDDDEDEENEDEEEENSDDTDEEDDNEDDTYDGQDETGREDIVDDLKYDLYNLTAYDYHGLRLPDDSKQKETVLKEKTARALQLLIKRVFSLPMDSDETGPLAVLPPDDVTKLPRSQRVPEPVAQTKWEKFAEEKGIKKKKRDRMVFDEANQEYAPRYGYKRVNGGIDDQPIVEIKAGQDPFADPWEAARVDKKQRVQKNLKNQVKNQERAARGKGKGKVSGLETLKSYDPSSVPGIPLGLQSGGAPLKRGRDGVKQALQLAQHSTASMGRFDELRKGEPVLKMKGKKRSFKDNFEGLGGGEKDNMKSQLRIVHDKVDKKARGVTNSLASYEGILPDAPTDTFRQKKGKGKAPKVGSKEGRRSDKKSGMKAFKRKH